MLTAEQQAALGGYGDYGKPQLPPPSGSTFRPFPGEMGRPGSYMPTKPIVTPPMQSRSMGIMGDFLLIALLGMLG